jgi:hypothetical protein
MFELILTLARLSLFFGCSQSFNFLVYLHQILILFSGRITLWLPDRPVVISTGDKRQMLAGLS